jgi:hypothetical protein
MTNVANFLFFYFFLIFPLDKTQRWVIISGMKQTNKTKEVTMNIKIKQAGQNFVAIVDGTHYWFGFYRAGYYELRANGFYYRILADYSIEDVRRALVYCGAI